MTKEAPKSNADLPQFPLAKISAEDSLLRDEVLESMQKRGVTKIWNLAAKPTQELLAMECAHSLSCDQSMLEEVSEGVLSEIFKAAKEKKGKEFSYAIQKHERSAARGMAVITSSAFLFQGFLTILVSGDLFVSSMSCIVSALYGAGAMACMRKQVKMFDETKRTENDRIGKEEEIRGLLASANVKLLPSPRQG